MITNKWKIDRLFSETHRLYIVVNYCNDVLNFSPKNTHTTQVRNQISHNCLFILELDPQQVTHNIASCGHWEQDVVYHQFCDRMKCFQPTHQQHFRITNNVQRESALSDSEFFTNVTLIVVRPSNIIWAQCKQTVKPLDNKNTSQQKRTPHAATVSTGY